MVVERFACRRMAWIVLSGTPSRYRFVASPRRNACQPCHASPACLSAGRMTNRASCARSSDVPVCDLKIKPVSGFPDAALWRARYFARGAMTGTGALLFALLGSSAWLPNTDSKAAQRRTIATADEPDSPGERQNRGFHPGTRALAQGAAEERGGFGD